MQIFIPNIKTWTKPSFLTTRVVNCSPHRSHINHVLSYKNRLGLESGFLWRSILFVTFNNCIMQCMHASKYAITTFLCMSRIDIVESGTCERRTDIYRTWSWRSWRWTWFFYRNYKCASPSLLPPSSSFVLFVRNRIERQSKVLVRRCDQSPFYSNYSRTSFKPTLFPILGNVNCLT